jgi:hypothetical protein
MPEAGHLEVTCAVHPNDYLVRELLDRGGVAFGAEGVHRDKSARTIRSEPVVSIRIARLCSNRSPKRRASAIPPKPRS